MTRTERALRDGAKFLLDHGWNRYDLQVIYRSHADKKEDEGKHDEARELRAAMEELRDA